MKMKWIGLVLSCLFVTSFFVGCGSPESRMVGKWVGGGATFEFFSDKTFTMKDNSGAGVGSYSGTWSILSDGRMKADVTVLWTKMIILGKIKDNSLIVDINGNKGVLVRPKNIEDKKSMITGKVTLSEETLGDSKRIAATKGNVGALKSSIAIYYGDNGLKWPRNLENSEFKKYLDKIPPEQFTGSRKIIYSDSDCRGLSNMQSFITNEGGWIYFWKCGDIFVNLTAKDSSGTPLYYYGFD